MAGKTPDPKKFIGKYLLHHGALYKILRLDFVGTSFLMLGKDTKGYWTTFHGVTLVFDLLKQNQAKLITKEEEKLFWMKYGW